MPTIRLTQRTLDRIKDRAIPFEDQEPEDVVKRLLDKTAGEGTGSETASVTPADLVTKGGRIPHGSKLRATYKGTEYHAGVDDGKIVWNSERFESLSKAAVAVIQSTGTDRETENGWRFWEVKTPESDKWRPARYLQSRSQDGRKKNQTLIERFNELPHEEQEERLRELERIAREMEKDQELGWNEAEEKAKGEVYRCEGRDGAHAFGEYRNGKLIVFQGSKAAFRCTEAAQRSKSIRDDLRERGVLKADADDTTQVFARDEAFSSPSPAAQAVLGRSANGWEEWKTRDGRTLDQVERW